MAITTTSSLPAPVQQSFSYKLLSVPLPNMIHQLYCESKIFSVSLLETTPAGVRQMLNEYSIPFLLEETESDDFDSMQKLKFFVKQVSNASDAGSSKSVKGSSGGVHTEFEARFMASFCSIHVNLIAPHIVDGIDVLTEIVKQAMNKDEEIPF